MKNLIGLLLIVSLCKSLPVENKNGKAFSIFSILTFPNEECTTTLGVIPPFPPTKGLCLTGKECSNAGGAAEGNCASGFGVCCYISVSATNSIITKNITYITGSSGGGGQNVRTWRYRVQGSADICFIRFDFDHFVLADPLNEITTNIGPDGMRISPNVVGEPSQSYQFPPNGYCGGRGDQFVVETETAGEQAGSTAPYWPGFLWLCGIMNGQHIYIPNSVNTDVASNTEIANITISIGTAAVSRYWKIKTSQIECHNPNVPDESCFQWFTGAGGRITNLTYQSRITLSEIQHSICIRREEGFCGFSVSQTTNAVISFNLQMTGYGLNTPLLSDVAQTDEHCMNEFIGIASTTGASRFCGGKLAAQNGASMPGIIHSKVLPFRINIGGINLNRDPNTGFDVTYRQTPC